VQDEVFGCGCNFGKALTSTLFQVFSPKAERPISLAAKQVQRKPRGSSIIAILASGAVLPRKCGHT
jgi:hypothetical protein